MILDELRRLEEAIPEKPQIYGTTTNFADAYSVVSAWRNYDYARAEFWKAYATWLDRWLARLNYATFDAERKKILAERNTAHDIVHLVREKEKS